jgi:polysaccharide chain length determinant protein (PEP-CTERM system associated)
MPPAAQRHLSGMWRRQRLILATAWAVAAIGWTVVALVPDQYQATTRIYVDTDNLLTPLLRNITVETDLQHRLEVMQRTLLSRTNLAEVVRVADMPLPADGELGLDRLYRTLQERIQVKAEGRNLFSVVYRNRDPALARRVVSSLLDIFVATNIGHNRANMEDARNFIDRQIAEYEDKLKEAERRLADYKARHVDILAATGSSFSVRLEALREEVNAARIKSREAEVTRDQLRAGLADVPQFIEVDSPWSVPAQGQQAAASPQLRIQQLEQQLAQLRAQYTDQYPEVVATRRALETARAQIGVAPIAGPAPGRARAANVVYDQLKLKLVQAEADVATAHSRLQIGEQAVARLATMAQEAPGVEAELADLNREYGVLKTKYEDLLGRRESARISAAAENSGDKVQFKVIEPPYAPLAPVSPIRPLWFTAVLIAALGAAGALAYVLELVDDTVGPSEGLSRDLGIPVLGCVPLLQGTKMAEARRPAPALAVAALAALALAYGALMAFELHRQPQPHRPAGDERTVPHDQH